VRIARDPREAQAMREAEPAARVFITGDLLVPARDGAGTLWSVQTVNPSFKGFMRQGRKAGLLTVAGARPEDLAKALQNDPAMALVLTEGYATGDTVARLARQPVVVAFDSGNLDAVARELRQRWPDRPLLIAADNDHLAAKETLPIGKPRGQRRCCQGPAGRREPPGRCDAAALRRGRARLRLERLRRAAW
jgi:phage/plasmid primase-like uncharacterized protein